MAVRYQAVVEADSLSCSEGTYTTSDSNQNIHDKSPIIYYKTEPSSHWRDLFKLPNDPRRRRIASIGCLLVLLFLIGLLIYIASSSFRLLKKLNKEEANTEYGLQMIPDLRVYKDGVFIYSASDNSAYEQIKAKYVNEINKFLNLYWEEQQKSQRYVTDCDAHGKVENKWCRFSRSKGFKNFNHECTSRDNFGFDTGEPCLLFAFKDEIKWTPEWMKGNQPEQLPFSCEIKTRFSTHQINATYFPPLSTNRSYGGFAMNKIPSLPIKSSTGFLVDDDGEIGYDLPPMLFVKLRKSEHNIKVNFACSIKDSVKDFAFSNLRDFVGVREVRFAVQTFEDL